MDIQRYALLIALALVGWMTLVEWNTFRLEHLPAAEAPAGIQGQSPALQSPPAADISAPAVAQTTSDLPEAHAPAAVAQPAAKTQSDTISVVTDTLQLEISLIGGDIVGAALPKFHAELGREDLPFKLLQQNTTRNYTAQSGLVGSDGTDTAQGRPRFSSAKTSWAMADGENSLVVALDLPNRNRRCDHQALHLHARLIRNRTRVHHRQSQRQALASRTLRTASP